MDDVRGLAPKSRTTVLRIVGRLLAERFDGNPVDIAAITPEHVRRFFAEQAALHTKPAGAGSVVSSLRGHFRYRASLGDLVHGLIGALAYRPTGPHGCRVAPSSSSPRPSAVRNGLSHGDGGQSLLASAGRPGPASSLREVVFETPFGLIASTGLRISEALSLKNADVDLKTLAAGSAAA